MISVIHKKGSSFKGLAAYLLHDKGEEDAAERVAWTHTHNLATDDPELAWRIQVATAMQQDDLKRSSGVGMAGNKSKNHVMHYSLSWHPDERQELTRSEMLQAALASMTFLGTKEDEKLGKSKTAKRRQLADEHQAVIVCHDEGENTPLHVHIMLNRVHPEHGVMLPTTMEKNKLSLWALEYRQAQGKEHLCPQRQKNWAKKAKGIATSNPRKPRNVYEQEQAANDADPGSRKKSLIEQQRRKATELKTKQEAMKRQQEKELDRLQQQHLLNEKMERDRAATEARQARASVKEQFVGKIDEITERQAAELAAFEEAKSTAAGRVRNSWAALKTKKWMTEIRTQPLQATTQAFKLAFSSGMQQQNLQAHHDQEQRQIHTQLRQQEQESARQARAEGDVRLDERRQIYERERSDMLFQQEMEKAKLKAEWNQLRQDQQATAAEDERARKSKNEHDQAEQKKQTEDLYERRGEAANTAAANAVGSSQEQAPGQSPGGEMANDNTRPAEVEESIQPAFEQSATPPPVPDPPPEDEGRQRKMETFSKQQEQQQHTQGQGNGQDITD